MIVPEFCMEGYFLKNNYERTHCFNITHYSLKHQIIGYFGLGGLRAPLLVADGSKAGQYFPLIFSLFFSSYFSF